MRKYTLFASALALSAGTLAITGCQTATPSKAQSADIRADVINVSSGGADYCKLLSTMTTLTPEQFVMVVDALASLASATECNVISQAMTNETGGDESNTQRASGPETPIDVSVPTGTDAITALVGAGATGITKGLMSADAANAAAAADCPDGDCDPPPAPK